MGLIPLEIPPGIVLTDSPNAAKGRYIGGDKFRFLGKYPEKWLGWRRWLGEADVLTGTARGATSWANTLGTQNVAIGTHLKLYAITGGDTLIDITPIRTSGTLGTDPFAVVIGSTTVTVTDTAHGVTQDAFVHFSGATAGGGITIDGEYQATRIVDADHYEIVHSVAATSTDATTGGAAADYEYEINPGSVNPSFGAGWGGGVWSGPEGWSDPHTSGLPVDMRHWSLHPYGNNLLAAPFGDTLYQWIEDSTVRAEAVSGAPLYMRGMFITAERFPFALGTDDGLGNVDPMRLQWPDQNDITDWIATAANTANTRTLQNGSKLIAGCALQDLLALVWSDTALYVFQYTGDESIYSSRLAGENCGLAGPLAFKTINGVAYWVSGFDFHAYSGAVTSIPNSGDVQEFFFGEMDYDLIQKTVCTHNPGKNALIWKFVSTSSTNSEPDKYVEVCLDNYAWSCGTIDRTTSTPYRPQDGSLLMVDPDGAIFLHEVGHDANGEAMDAYIKYGLYSLTNGEQNVDIFGLVPDFERQSGDIEVTIYTKERPNSAANFDEQVLTVAEGDEIADTRVSGRHFGLIMRSNVVGGDLRGGISALEVGRAGMRR